MTYKVFGGTSSLIQSINHYRDSSELSVMEVYTPSFLFMKPWLSCRILTVLADDFVHNLYRHLLISMGSGRKMYGRLSSVWRLPVALFSTLHMWRFSLQLSIHTWCHLAVCSILSLRSFISHVVLRYCISGASGYYNHMQIRCVQWCNQGRCHAGWQLTVSPLVFPSKNWPTFFSHCC